MQLTVDLQFDSSPCFIDSQYIRLDFSGGVLRGRRCESVQNYVVFPSFCFVPPEAVSVKHRLLVRMRK